jgi:hypothetical protein
VKATLEELKQSVDEYTTITEEFQWMTEELGEKICKDREDTNHLTTSLHYLMFIKNASTTE